MYICVDFDGTIVTHEFPHIGKEVPGAIDALKAMIAKDHKIILFTMRSGEYLDRAVTYLNSHGIILFGINENPTQKEWTSSPKAYGHIYIDDANVGCPLIPGEQAHERPYVNWAKVREILDI